MFQGWKKNLLEIPVRADEYEKMAGYVSNQFLTDTGAIKRDDFLELDEILQPVILHSILKKRFPEEKVSRGFLENLSVLESIQTGASITVSEGLSIIRNRDFFIFKKKNEIDNHSYLITRKELQSGLSLLEYQLIIEELPEKFDPDSLSIDFDKIKYPLRLRKWKNGDSFIPFGMKGTQLVSDHLTNRKIPSFLKRSAHVIETFDQTICAVIFPVYSGISEVGTISDSYRCTNTTVKTLTIRKSINNESLSAGNSKC